MSLGIPASRALVILLVAKQPAGQWGWQECFSLQKGMCWVGAAPQGAGMTLAFDNQTGGQEKLGVLRVWTGDTARSWSVCSGILAAGPPQADPHQGSLSKHLMKNRLGRVKRRQTNQWCLVLHLMKVLSYEAAIKKWNGSTWTPSKVGKIIAPTP